MITGLNHLTLAVGDLDRSFAFYVERLGCRPEARWDRGAYLSAGDLWLCLSLDEPRPAGDYSHVAFGVAPGTFGATVARLEDAGVARWKADTSEGESFYFLDPDGHRLELHEGDLASRLAVVAREPYAGWVRFGPDGETASDDDRRHEIATPFLKVAGPADVPALESCARAAYARYVERIGREPAPMVADFAALVARERVRVAERAERLAGYVVVEERPDELHLESVAVLPEHGGTGLGRRLVTAVEEEARRLGLPAVTLYTNARMHENLTLYPHLGYVETGRRREDGFDRVFFEKRL